MRKWCGREAVIALFLRQLKFPLSNNNRLSNHWAVSTRTFVILSVILGLGSGENLGWQKWPPGWAKAEATSKIPLKGLFVVVVLKLTKQLHALRLITLNVINEGVVPSVLFFVLSLETNHHESNTHRFYLNTLSFYDTSFEQLSRRWDSLHE